METHDIATLTPQLPTLPPQREIMNPARYWATLADTLVVDDQPSFEFAAEQLQKLKADHATLTEKRLSFTRPLDALKKSWMEFFGAPIALLEGAEMIYKRKLLGYKEEQDRKRKEEEATVRALMEEEQKRREAEVAALARKAEEEWQRANAAAKAGDDAAAKDAAKKSAQLVEAARETILARVAPPPIETQLAKATGISSSYQYSAAIENLGALIKAISEGRESIALIDADAVLKKVSARARIEKEAFRITGCQLIKTPVLTARR